MYCPNKHKHMHGCTRTGLARLSGAAEREGAASVEFFFFFPPAATVIPCFYCLYSSFVLLVWLCSHCPIPKLAEELEPDKHTAHTSGQICGIFPRRKQLTPSNEHMLLLLQLCHHNYWPKSVPSYHLRVF